MEQAGLSAKLPPGFEAELKQPWLLFSQPLSELQFTMLTFGQLYLDCKVIGDHHCALAIAAVLATLAKTLEFFLSPAEPLALTSMPCNGSAVRRSPGLWGSDLQILLHLPSRQ